MANQELIVKLFEGSKIFFMENGWVNATKAAKPYHKKVNDWLKLEQTKEYIAEVLWELNEKLNGRIPDFEQNQQLTYDDLVKVKTGAPSTGGGTWIHPELAVEFGRWLEVKFARWMDHTIQQIINKWGCWMGTVVIRSTCD